jgi:Ca-activated chloride channel family protein
VSFEWPLMLLALLVVPLALAGYLLAERRPARYALSFTNLDVLASVVDRPSLWRRYLPLALFLLALAALAVGLARPEVNVTQQRENATVVLVIDSSGSMLAKDVAPTRLRAAKRAVRTFLERIPDQFRVGLVAFAAEPQVLSPPTTNRQVILSSLDFLVPLRGTAIGDALARAAEVARNAGATDGRTLASVAAPSPSDRSPVTILLLSDGMQTAGLLTPLDGARRAEALRVPVYTIALGTPDGVLDLDFGGFGRQIPVPPDPVTLGAIAEETGGRFFDAPSAEALEAAYSELGSLLSREPGELEATFAFLGGGALLLLAAATLSALWSGRLP